MKSLFVFCKEERSSFSLSNFSFSSLFKFESLPFWGILLVFSGSLVFGFFVSFLGASFLGLVCVGLFLILFVRFGFSLADVGFLTVIFPPPVLDLAFICDFYIFYFYIN